MLKPGQTVYHAHFGRGTVTHCYGDTSSVDFGYVRRTITNDYLSTEIPTRYSKRSQSEIERAWSLPTPDWVM